MPCRCSGRQGVAQTGVGFDRRQQLGPVHGARLEPLRFLAGKLAIQVPDQPYLIEPG
ncbi:MAG TPA: hypothetical protein VLB69_00450 [Rudaea sp.]|nr:hypothetical protein [Rudaea sp.]